MKLSQTPFIKIKRKTVFINIKRSINKSCDIMILSCDEDQGTIKNMQKKW